MDVLEEGTVKEWSKVAECNECHAMLRVYKKDLYFMNTAVAYAGETWNPGIRADCAVCNSYMDLTDLVPYGIRNELETAYRKKYK